MPRMQTLWRSILAMAAVFTTVLIGLVLYGIEVVWAVIAPFVSGNGDNGGSHDHASMKRRGA
jgi:hypothetical protein